MTIKEFSQLCSNYLSLASDYRKSRDVSEANDLAKQMRLTKEKIEVVVRTSHERLYYSKNSLDCKLLTLIRGSY